MLFLPLVKEQLSKLSLFNVGKGVINNCQKLILKGEITVIETQNGMLQGHNCFLQKFKGLFYLISLASLSF